MLHQLIATIILYVVDSIHRYFSNNSIALGGLAIGEGKSYAVLFISVEMAWFGWLHVLTETTTGTGKRVVMQLVCMIFKRDLIYTFELIKNEKKEKKIVK